MGKKKQVEVLEVEKNKGGRPTHYSVDFAHKFCEELPKFNSIQACCDSDKSFPANDCTIFEWLVKFAEFAELYKRANKIRAFRLVEQALLISDDDSRDLLTNQLTGEQKCNTTAVTRSALRVNTRFKLAKHFNPEVFGEKPVDEKPNIFNLVLNKDDVKL